jgi:hypothetical protein
MYRCNCVIAYCLQCCWIHEEKCGDDYGYTLLHCGQYYRPIPILTTGEASVSGNYSLPRDVGILADINLQTGFTATSTCFGIAILLMMVLIVLVRFENSRRDRVHGFTEDAVTNEHEGHVLENDLTDGNNPNFRYVM